MTMRRIARSGAPLMQADPDWQTYLKKNREAGYLVSQVTKLMTPAKFAKIAR